MNSRERRKRAAEKHNQALEDKKTRKVATINHRSNNKALVMALGAALASSSISRRNDNE